MNKLLIIAMTCLLGSSGLMAQDSLSKVLLLNTSNRSSSFQFLVDDDINGREWYSSSSNWLSALVPSLRWESDTNFSEVGFKSFHMAGLTNLLYEETLVSEDRDFISVGIYFERSYRVWFWGNTRLNLGFQPALTYEYDANWRSSPPVVRHKVHSAQFDFMVVPRISRDLGKRMLFDFSYQLLMGSLNYYNVEYDKVADDFRANGEFDQMNLSVPMTGYLQASIGFKI